MKTYPVSKIRSFIIVIALCILSLSIGYRFGERKTSISLSPDSRLIINQKPSISDPIDFSLFWDVWRRLSASYIDRANMDAQKMVWGAISGMVSALDDPYTVFLPPKDNSDFKEELGGQFEGIGAQLGLKDGHIMVIAPLKGMPAEAEGIRAGDYILEVDGVETVGWTVEEAVTKIRGPRGTTVKLSILHESALKPVEVSIVRNTITVASVDSWVKRVSDIKEISGAPSVAKLKNTQSSVAYIHLSRFGDRTNDEWSAAVDEVVAAQKANPSLKGLIFDLRNNPGGYLEGAVFIGSEFIKSGTIVSQKNSNGSQEDYPVVREGKLLDIPMVVLINKGSASAAEIVAGAIKDYNRGTIVGETSFGKGSVQTPEELSGGAGLHITTGKWLLPKGDWIHKKGITPDVVIESTYQEATMDAQLAKAVELLLE